MKFPTNETCSSLQFSYVDLFLGDRVADTLITFSCMFSESVQLRLRYGSVRPRLQLYFWQCKAEILGLSGSDGPLKGIQNRHILL